MADTVIACRSTRHCADWGFCHRCAPGLAEEASRRYGDASKEVDESQWSGLYAEIVRALLPPVPTRPLAVGDVLHGFCGGYFGRDHYDCCVIEAVGPDWIVTRDLDRDDDSTGLDFASGQECLAKLREYRTPTTKPADGITPCCEVTE